MRCLVYYISVITISITLPILASGPNVRNVSQRERLELPQRCRPLPCRTPFNCHCTSSCIMADSQCEWDQQPVYCPGHEAKVPLPAEIRPSIVYWRPGAPCMVTINPGATTVTELTCIFGVCKISNNERIDKCSPTQRMGAFSLIYDNQATDVLIRIRYKDMSVNPPTTPVIRTEVPSTSTVFSTTPTISSPTPTLFSTKPTISSATPTPSSVTSPSTTSTMTSSRINPTSSTTTTISRPSTSSNTGNKFTPIEAQGSSALSVGAIAIVATLSIVIIVTAILIGVFLRFFKKEPTEKMKYSEGQGYSPSFI